jgi:phosphatidylserine decarboxylase
MRDDLGSLTTILLVEKGVVKWDEDLLINSRASLESMGIGNGCRTPVSAA